MKTLLATLPVLSLLAACSGAPTDGASDTTDQELRVCAGGQTVEGVDVSYYDPNINWTALKAGGIDFAFIRVADGHFVDPEFQTSWAGAKKAGVLRGAYQFFRPEQDPVAQADLLIAHMGPLDANDLSPVIDVEVADGVSGATTAARVGQWLNEIKAKTGRTGIVYTASGFWNGLGTKSYGQNPLWVANWGVSCPGMPSSWKSWKFWQYTDHGTVPGIANKVDRSKFNGSLSDLKAFAGH